MTRAPDRAPEGKPLPAALRDVGSARARREKARSGYDSAHAGFVAAVLAAVESGASYRAIGRAAGITAGRVAQLVAAVRGGEAD